MHRPKTNPSPPIHSLNWLSFIRHVGKPSPPLTHSCCRSSFWSFSPSTYVNTRAPRLMRGPDFYNAENNNSLPISIDVNMLLSVPLQTLKWGNVGNIRWGTYIIYLGEYNENSGLYSTGRIESLCWYHEEYRTSTPPSPTNKKYPSDHITSRPARFRHIWIWIWKPPFLPVMFIPFIQQSKYVA